MKTITRSIIVLLSLMFAALSGACTAQVEQPVEVKDVAATSESCDMVASGPTEQVWRFSNKDTAAPVGLECISLGGGMFKCDAEACLVLPYTGTCPHCGGGGE